MTAFRRALRWVGIARGLAADTREDIFTADCLGDGEESRWCGDRLRA